MLTGVLGPMCRYLIRPDPLSQVPNQNTNRKCSAGLSDSHRFEMQDSTHLWGTEKGYSYCQITAREMEQQKKKKQKQLLQRFEKCGDAKECSQMTPCSRVYVGSPERRRSCMDLVSQLAMFYLCTFSFQNLSAADTEVHLMKKCRYLYLCSCACCALHLVCSLYGPKWTNMIISLWIKSKTQFSWDSQRTYAA